MVLTLVASTLVVALLYLLAVTAKIGAVTLVAGGLAGLTGLGIARMLDWPRGAVAQALIVAAGGACIGAALRPALGLSGDLVFEWLGVLLAAAVAPVGWVVKLGGRRQPCFVCKTPTAEDSTLQCPRCGQRVCARPSCWEAPHLRCSMCHAREVVLFPGQENWWRAQFGPKLTSGQCVSCLREADKADLRECGQCHWPMCRRCWDYHNGRCGRCGWMIPSPPPALLRYLGRRR